MDRVVPQPRPRGMRADTRRPSSAPAACPGTRPRCSPAVGSPRIATSASSQSRQVALDPSEAVVGRRDLLAVVEDQGQVVRRVGDRRRQMQEHRVAGLHVRRCRSPCSTPPSTAGGHVVGDRHGVEVPGEHHPARQARGGYGRAPQLPLRTTSNPSVCSRSAFSTASAMSDLVLRHARNVDEGGGEVDGVGMQVEVRYGHR